MLEIIDNLYLLSTETQTIEFLTNFLLSVNFIISLENGYSYFEMNINKKAKNAPYSEVNLKKIF